MNYFLTQYCFPLEEKICISKKLNFFLTNPETEEAFILGLQLAKKIGADLILATDPDADRLGVYV